ncbi:apolipoprotein B receptor [Physeter macrocephalus]|uniref:Apolipoprotein B receptor n=1 Tax=Physeter macrocephalus TaxID=9755 RepID=A0A2Y9ERE6_PHYMC|nr:apolipoprotein B receptor [Physeter catodon]|eukprot:XP_007107504.2 apolipoprotein B receptor [Physeter catodon]
MDFLRLHLPGLHQALRGALESFSTFVSYLMGDDVPTAERREACAAEELGEVAARSLGGKVEEEAQEAVEGLGGSQNKGDGGLRGPGEAGRCQEESSATEQTWGGGQGSSHGSQADRQDTGAWEAATATRCQHSSIPLEPRQKSEAGRDRSSQAQGSQQPDEQEVKREETLRTWEREEEEEEVRATEPGVAGGAESEGTWHKELERKASVDGQKVVAEDGKESEQGVDETAAEEIQGPGAKGAGRGEEVVVVRGDQSTRAQGTREPAAESEDRETSGREEADLPGTGETEHGAVPGERIPEGTGRVWALEETSRGDQEEEEVDENREAEASLFPTQTQALGSETVEEAAKDQAAGREAEEGQESEAEGGEGFEGQAHQAEEEAVERQDSEIRAAQTSLKEVVQAEEAKEQQKSCRAAEAELLQDKVANEAEGDVDLEATPEARPKKEFSRERGEEEAQTRGEALEVGWGGLEHRVTEGQEPELVAGPQTPTEQLEEGQACKEELWSMPALSREETERSREEYPRNVGYVEPNSSVAEAWEDRRRDVERGDTQEEKGDAEEGKEEATGGQAPVAEAEGGRESARPEVPEGGGEWMKVKEAWRGAEEGEAPGAENQELGGRQGAGTGTAQSLGESDATETKEEEVEASVPWGADRTSRRGWRLEAEALSLQDSDDMDTHSLATEIVEDKAALDGRAPGTGDRPGREAEEAFGRDWDSEGREEAGGGEDLVEAAEGEKRGGQEFGLEGSAEEEVPGSGGQAEASEATREGEPGGQQAEVEESTVAEGSWGMDGVTPGSQVLRVEGLPGGHTLWEEEAGGGQATEQGQSSEGQLGDRHPEGEAQRPLAVEDIEVTGDQKAEAKEIDPEGLEDVQGQEDRSTNQDPAEAEPGPCGEATGSAREDGHSSWSEALLPGSRLDVSVPRSRALLSRSSSQRRSRPSFRRTPAPEQAQEPPSPPPEEELVAPEQSLLEPEHAPEPSSSSPEGTPLPARRPLGQRFGLAHPGMMQELRARLSQPKPQ